MVMIKRTKNITVICNLGKVKGTNNWPCRYFL